MSVINGQETGECTICHKDNWNTMQLHADIEGHTCQATVEASTGLYTQKHDTVSFLMFLFCETCGYMKLMR